AEREEAEAEGREQRLAAKARKEKLEAALAEASERNKRFERELTALRRERDDLHGKVATEQRVAARSRQQADDVQQRLNDALAESERFDSDYQRHSVDRERLESKWREQLEAAKTQKKELEAAWADAVERNMHFEEE